MVGQKEEAEDLTQEVFIHVYQKITRFNPAKKFKPWLYRVAVNTCISRLRRKQKVVFLNYDDALTGNVTLDAIRYPSPDKNMRGMTFNRRYRPSWRCRKLPGHDCPALSVRSHQHRNS